MKKTLLTVLSLLICLLMLSACGLLGNEGADIDDGPSLLDPLPPVDGPFNDSDDIASSAFVGTFVNSYSALSASLASSVFPEGAEKTPTLVCNPDGTFTLSVMSDMAQRTMRTVGGTFTVSGDSATFTVTEGEPGEVQFTLTFASADELHYAGDQIDCVSQGDLFLRQSA